MYEKYNLLLCLFSSFFIVLHRYSLYAFINYGFIYRLLGLLGYVHDSDMQRCEWLNAVLLKLWSKMTPAICELVKTKVGGDYVDIATYVT